MIELIEELTLRGGGFRSDSRSVLHCTIPPS
jgi:hypothetical protein